jgi:hypothetical protein
VDLESGKDDCAAGLRDGRTCDGRSVKRAGRRGLDGYGML